MFRIAVLACLGLVPSAQAAPIDDLRAAFGAEAFASPRTFHYRLVIKDAAGQVASDARYSLDTATGALHRVAPDRTAWFDGAAGYAIEGGRLVLLDRATESSLAGHAQSNFARLFADPKTRVELIGVDLRISPASGEGFTVRRDPKTGLIRENVFDDGRVARESDYRDVDGLQWPMVFEVLDQGTVVRRGEFSEAKLGSHEPLPAIVISADEATVLSPPVRGAALVGAALVSTDANEYNLVTDAAGTALVFARSEPKFANARIHASRRGSSNDAWPAPTPVDFTDPRYGDSDPWLSPDGSTLYFVSNRPRPGDADTPRKDADVWRARFVDGKFAAPEWLGARVNSDGMELGPEAHGDWLYFNSSRPGGPAGLSIYRVSLAGDAAPQALPATINAGVMQGDFTISPDGNTALFWQQPKGGNADIHRATRDGDTWTNVERLPAPFSSPGFDFTPHFIDGGRAIAFASMRTTTLPTSGVPVLNGQSNVYVARAPAR